MKTKELSQAATVAEIINAQIGHRAFMMLGAMNKVGGENFLQFKIRGSRKVTNVRIELDQSDTYTVKFFKIRGFDVKEIASVSDVYADSLRKVIETNTGLYTSL